MDQRDRGGGKLPKRSTRAPSGKKGSMGCVSGSGTYVLEHFINHYGRPYNGFENTQDTGPKTGCLNNKIDHGTYETDTVNSSCLGDTF